MEDCCSIVTKRSSESAPKTGPDGVPEVALTAAARRLAVHDPCRETAGAQFRLERAGSTI
jgi:hypothetical protein